MRDEMALRSHPPISADEYLARERRALQKSELIDGRIVAMSGASERHNLIVVNIVSTLAQQLRGRSCKVYPSDMRVKVSATNLYTYPDISALCGEARFDDEHKDTLVNPTIIIEVLSQSTEAYDRGLKFEHYRRIESLVEYVLVAQDRIHVDCHRRGKDGQWALEEAGESRGVIKLHTVDCDLSLTDVYDKVGIES